MNHRNATHRTGMTQLELLLILVGCATLFILIMPFIQLARTNARHAGCENNLRRLGIVFHTLAERDPQLRLATGIPSLIHDGPPNEIGWVADVVNYDAELTSALRCRSNPMRDSEVLAELMEYNQGTVMSWPPSDPPNQFHQGLGTSGPPNSKGRANYVQRQFLDKDYRTNYAASWYFGRTTLKAFNQCWSITIVSSPTTLNGAVGPLTLASADYADTPMSNIPLLGDAAASNTPFKASNLLTNVADKLARTMNHGPAYWNHRENRMILLDQAGSEKKLVGRPVQSFKQGVDILLCLEGDKAPSPNDTQLSHQQVMRSPASWNQFYGGKDKVLWLQDTTAWAPVHHGRLNLLMADGAVKSFPDVNGDGYLNPGFPKVTSPSLWNSKLSNEEFVELPDYQCFNRALLTRDLPIGCYNGFRSD